MILAALTLALAVTAHAPADPVAVYVFTQTQALTDVNQQARQKAVADIRQQLAKKKAIRVVDEAASAMATFEVTDAGMRETGTEERQFYLTKKQRRPTITGKLTAAGGYALEMQAIDPASLSGRKGADDIAKAIEKWVKDNRAQLAR